VVSLRLPPLRARREGHPPARQPLPRALLLETLKAVGGSTSKAARILGISPRKIQYRLHAYSHPEAAPLHDDHDD
jgi:DNA-binding NtrC family response regulator